MKKTSKTLMLMNAGGLRSLVAAAIHHYNEPDTRLWLVFVDDGRANSGHCFQYAQKQAKWLEAFRLDRLQSVVAGQLASTPANQARSSGNLENVPSSANHVATNAAMPDQIQPPPPFRRPMAVLSALAYAHKRRMSQLDVPAGCNNQIQLTSQVTEQLLVCQQLLAHEPLVTDGHNGLTQAPHIQTPLLDFSDQQIVELGLQMQVPFEWSWSCITAADTPCDRCHGCLRRAQAFKQAGVPDPQRGQLNKTRDKVHDKIRAQARI